MMRLLRRFRATTESSLLSKKKLFPQPNLTLTVEKPDGMLVMLWACSLQKQVM